MSIKRDNLEADLAEHLAEAYGGDFETFRADVGAVCATLREQAVRAALAGLDGTDGAAVALLSGVSAQELEELGGAPEGGAA